MMTFFKILMMLVPVLLGVAFMTLMERKVLGYVGLRPGPLKVSALGVLQPISDAAKLASKQFNYLSNFSAFWYYSSAFLVFVSSLFLWGSGFSNPGGVSLKMGFVVVMLFLSLSSINSMVLGWSTFSKLSLVGSLRTVCQLISYESLLYLVFFFVIFIWSCYSIGNIASHEFWFFICSPFCLFLWIPSVLAELNRTPYDFSEGESELVSGFNTEFGSVSFTLIFLAEYANILFFCWMTTLIFFGGRDFFVVAFFSFMVIWIRGVLPRFRYDKLMMMVWKFLLPFLTIYLLVFSAVIL